MQIGQSAKDITGQAFGRLVAVGPYDYVGEGRVRLVRWRCVCECGGEKIAVGSQLRCGAVKSCGCLQNEARAASGRSKRTHGETKTPEYKAWQIMRQRCGNPNDKDFANWGGRGITVCARWEDFTCFLADMGRRPSPAHSIDREDNSKGYSPENCRWATSAQQNRNTRNNLIVSAFGRRGPLVEFIPMGGHSAEYQRARKRIVAGWDHEAAIAFALSGGRNA